jgi:hypothetical protein
MVVKTLEAALAIVIILSSIVILFPKSNVQQQNSYSAYNCLVQMDQEGTLRYYASNNLESNLNSELGYCIPVTFNYTARICASSACSAQTPSDRAVFLSSYIMAVDYPVIINVWVWSR